MSTPFGSENKIVQLCAKGMELEGSDDQQARKLFQQAWEESESDYDRFIVAHYLARQQADISGKLTWDLRALEHALRTDDETIKGVFPSLYLNIGKCYEDLEENLNAHTNYLLANNYSDFLADDGYGKMIRRGIADGLERIQKKLSGVHK